MDLLQTELAERIFNLSERLRPTKSQSRLVLSVNRLIGAMAQGRLQHGAPDEYAAWGCEQNNPQRVVIPFEHLMACAERDLNTSVPSAGGYLAGTKTKILTFPLVGSNVVQAGANVVLNATQNSVHPHVTTKPPFTWLPTETSTVPNDTTTVLNQAAGVIHRGGINLRVSRQLTLQSNADIVLPRLLSQLGNDALDIGVLNGSGASGQPLGLFNMTGPVAVSGASLNMLGLATLEENCVAADADDRRLAFFTTPAVRRLLRQREITAAGGSIWPGRDLLGHPAFVTSKMPSASMLTGDFSNIDILLFGNGVEVLVNPYADFQSGRIEFQVSVAMDFVAHYPASFSKSTSIT